MRDNGTTQINEIQKQINNLDNEINIHKKIAKRKTKLLLSLFLIVLALYGSFLVWAIYVYYTWDIMEPIVYFIEYVVFLTLLSTFFFTKKLFTPQRLRLNIYKYFLRKKLMKKGVDLSDFEILKIRLRNLQKFHANKLFNSRF